MDHPGSYKGMAIKQLTARATFYHVVCEVMGVDDGDLLLKALDGNGIVSIHDVICLTDYQIDTMSFDDGAGVWLLPSLASRNKIRVLRSWNHHLQLVQGRRVVDWMDDATVNEDEWDEYRAGVYVPLEAPATPIPRAKLAASRGSRPLPVKSPAPASDLPVPDSNYQSETMEDTLECLSHDDVPDDGEPGNGEHGSEDGMGLGFSDFGADTPVLGSEGTMVGFANDGDVGGEYCDDIMADCCGERSSSAGKMVALKTEHDMDSFFGTNEGDYPLESVAIHLTTGFVSTFDFDEEPNIVFDPGGGPRDVYEWDEFFGCDWFTPAPEQYLNLLLLDRGE